MLKYVLNSRMPKCNTMLQSENDLLNPKFNQIRMEIANLWPLFRSLNTRRRAIEEIFSSSSREIVEASVPFVYIYKYLNISCVYLFIYSLLA